MKKNISKSIKSLATVALLVIYLNSYGQDKKQEISISLGGPFSYLDYSAAGELVDGNGFSAGLRYSYYLNETISIGIGVEYQTYRSDSKSSFLSGQYMTTDAENEAFQFRYKATNLREEQNLGYINIPIGIQYETPGTSQLYLAGGFKIGFAANGKYETKIENLTTSGYYPQYNVELFAPSFAGFANTDNIKTNKQDLDTDVSYSATFETGLKQKIGSKSSLYIGAYLDYGLNNIYDKKVGKNLIQYNPELPVQLGYNSILDSSLSSDVILISYGIKLRYALH
ncbi:outer membrane beta-barrel protein [Flavobacterium sp. LC2016-12]|uniref:outer membrane beta-barrel protein n=1 Tax=Flavobacterium sp. LC2016-12 TaxID=2783794 RepID=UPI00188A33F8|nr:outer membrane beta-barrel protein [Flavobacterium sp. LC2016-12]MBF4465047.1 outer membrane beta-barrel protein [Flavobacterium sp. LC2016-12]